MPWVVVWVHLALQESGGSIFAALIAAFKEVGDTWIDWQGTYSAILLMSLEPGVFGEQFYVLAAPIVLTTLILGTFFFFHVYICELMEGPRGIWLGLSSLVVVVQLLLVPSPVEAIFWYNSSIYYTTYNAAMLALFGFVGRICTANSKKAPRSQMIAYCLLSIFIAGGNFVTALVTAEIMFAVFIYQLIKKRACSFDILVGFTLLVLGLVVSFLAPGNAVRQATQFAEDSAGVIGTIWGSSLAAFQYLYEWANGLVAMLIIACVPLALYVLPRAIEKGFMFKWPGWVAVASVALFATSFTPTFWAEGDEGPGRVQDCRYEIFILLLVVNVFWIVGWILSQKQKRTEPNLDTSLTASTRASFATSFSPAIAAQQVCIWFGCAVLVFSCIVGVMATDDNLGEDLSSVSAARSLISGKAAAYHEQVLERLDTIENSTEASLEVPFYHDIPHVLWMGDIRDNMSNYINYRLAQWYGKDSIIGYSASASKKASVDGVSDD